jgi:hypothetical protein
VKLVYTTSLGDFYDYSYTDAANGSVTFEPICIGSPVQSGGSGMFCSFSLPGINQVIVEAPPGVNSGALSAPGITEGVQICWTYQYIFGSINPAQ